MQKLLSLQLGLLILLGSLAPLAHAMVPAKQCLRKPTELPHVNFFKVIRRVAASVFRGGNAIAKQNTQE